MYADKFDLAVLTRRVSRKDAAACAALKQELEPGLVYIVRRVMRTRTAQFPFERQVLAEINRLPNQGRGLTAEQQERLVEVVARRVSASSVEEVRAGPAYSLTPSERGYETVVA